MNRKDVTKKVLDIMSNLKSTNSLDFTNDEMLTGTKINLDYIDMVYLAIELMELFQIEFQLKDFENYGFSSVNKIVDIIIKKEKEKEKLKNEKKNKKRI